MSRRCLVLALAGAGLIACSSTSSEAPAAADAGSDDATQTADSAAPDVWSAVTETIGPSGGTVTAPGVAVTIPAGALPADTAISIDPNAGPVPPGYMALSHFFAFGPAGTTLLKPATVDFSLTTPGVKPVIYWANGAGGFDALTTTSTATTASTNAIVRLGEAFVAEEKNAPLDASIDDASVTVDAAPAADGASPDATTNGDAGGTQDSGIDGAGPNEGGVAEAAVADASKTDASKADAATADSGTLGDGGAVGIWITIDGASTPTLFGTNLSVSTNGSNIWTMIADDNPSGVRWSVELQVSGLAQQAVCQTIGDPFVTYTHYLNGAPVAVFTTQIAGGACLFSFIGTPTAHAQYAHGTFSATVTESADAGGLSHTFTGGSYNLLY